MRIAIDAMGGDHAPGATVAGAVAAARELGVSMLLVGDRQRLEAELTEHRTAGLDIELCHATESIGMDEPPTAALGRLDSSMYGSFAAARDGRAAAVVFAGNTGAGMVLGAHVLGRCPGVERPAIAVLLPCSRGHTVLLDAGANVDCRPIHLVQFAVMGDAFARAVAQVPAPRIGLLSNGLEDSKGNELARAVAPLLRQLPINFVGYVEGREATSGMVDVAVCDGFVGNVVLKGLEGFGRLVGTELGAVFRGGLRGRLAYLLVRRDLEGLRRKLDAGETGGALLLGLNGTAVKAHGSSDARAIRNAIKVAADLARSDVTRQVAQGMAATVGLDGALEPRRARRLWESIRGRLRREGRGADGQRSERPAGGPAAPATAAAPDPRGGAPATAAHGPPGSESAAPSPAAAPAEREGKRAGEREEK